jgi:hypothetical protein
VSLVEASGQGCAVIFPESIVIALVTVGASEGHLSETSAKLRGIIPDWYHSAYRSEN